MKMAGLTRQIKLMYLVRMTQFYVNVVYLKFKHLTGADDNTNESKQFVR